MGKWMLIISEMFNRSRIALGLKFISNQTQNYLIWVVGLPKQTEDWATRHLENRINKININNFFERREKKMESLAKKECAEVVSVPLFFEKEVVVTFSYTNAEGNVSHHVYAKIFGDVRELFGLDCIPRFAEEAGKAFLMKTRSAKYEYRRDFYFGDIILVKMYVKEVRGASFLLVAEFINKSTGEMHATGEQLIVYAGIDGKPRRLPKELKEMLFAVSGLTLN